MRWSAGRGEWSLATRLRWCWLDIRDFLLILNICGVLVGKGIELTTTLAHVIAFTLRRKPPFHIQKSHPLACLVPSPRSRAGISGTGYSRQALEDFILRFGLGSGELVLLVPAQLRWGRGGSLWPSSGMSHDDCII